MKLLVSELKTSIYQVVTPSENTQVEAVRVNLYKHNFPGGNLTLEIHDSNGELITSSATSLTAGAVSSADFFHGFVRFYINASLMKNVSYRIVLKATGYTFSESAYFGWCVGFDLEVYPPSYDPALGFNAPLALEIWERR